MKNYLFPTKNIENIDELQDVLLKKLGFTSEEQKQNFLTPNYDTGRHDPFLLNDMEKAVVRILRAINDKEKIVIFSDYDCDGIPGAVVLHDFFKAVGYENFTNYIPHRHYEGFGLSIEAVDKLAKEKADLIITIDCGTTNFEAVGQANRKNIDVIITDHHEPKEELPKALAVVNPKVGDKYPFADLCGAGVVFKLVEALLERGEFEIIKGKEKWWLDMVGLATVSDMVPLIGENRVFAYYGLQVLRKSRRPGLQRLLRKAKASQRFLTEDDIGFTIGPRINAASRMDTPEDAFNMLSSTDEGEAGGYVDHLEKLNNERKGLVASMSKELKKRVKEMPDLPEVLVLGSPEWRPSLVGLAANSLAEEHQRPVFLWGRDGNGFLKGSCRSDGKVSVITLMDAVSDSFVEHGGHHASGGFTIKEEAIHTLGENLSQARRDLGEKALSNEDVIIDAYIKLEEVNQKLLQILRTLAPFGVGNPKPLFAFKNVRPSELNMFGKTKEHLKLNFETTGRPLEAIAFFASPESFSKEAKVGEELTLLAHVEESFFMNRRQTRLRIVDIV